MPMMVILAGGLATRMRPLTDALPKCLLPVAGRPFIHHQLELFASQGISRVLICTGYLGEMVEEALARWSGMEISFSRDWPQRLGTGGAIKNALDLLDDEFMVIYGDSYLAIDYQLPVEKFRQSGRDALMTVCRDRRNRGEGNTAFGNGLILAYDKHGPPRDWIDYGLSLFKKQVFQSLPETVFDLGDVFAHLARNGQLAGMEETVPFQEIGSLSGYEDFRDYMADSEGSTA